ncbi:MAG: flavodoxin [Myxococcota bacterium]
MKIGLIFGTTTGNTEDAADEIATSFGDAIAAQLDIESTSIEDLSNYDVLLIGCPTYDIGELQNDWYFAAEKLEASSVRLDGVRVAFFGDGDQGGYPHNFQDALGILRDLFVARGATADIGHWPTDDYEFEESKALVDGKFAGLALDSLNQGDLTEERIQAWCEQLKRELSLS